MKNGRYAAAYHSVACILAMILMAGCQTSQSVSPSRPVIQAADEDKQGAKLESQENPWAHPEQAFTPMEFLIKVLKVAEAGLDTPEHFEKEFGVKLKLLAPQRDGDPTQYIADAGKHWFFRAILVPSPTPRRDNYLGGVSIFPPESKNFCLDGYKADSFVLSQGWEKRIDPSRVASGHSGTYFAKRIAEQEISLHMDGRCIAHIGITNRSLTRP